MGMSMTEKRFRAALSGVIARHMKRAGMGCVHDVVKAMPDRQAVAAHTVYSAVTGRGKASAFTLHQVAGALGVTMDELVREAKLVMDSGGKLPSVWDLFPDARMEKKRLKAADEAKKKKRR